MAYKIFNRVRETVSSTGAGAVTVSGAVAKHQGFATAGFTTGDTFPYTIDVPSGPWEEGVATYNSNGTISRTLTASSTGSLLNLTGEAGTTLACVPTAEHFGRYVLLAGADFASGTLTVNGVAVVGGTGTGTGSGTVNSGVTDHLAYYAGNGTAVSSLTLSTSFSIASGTLSLAQATTSLLGGVTFSASNPVMDGVADPGNATSAARSNHVHASDTSRADTTLSNLSNAGLARTNLGLANAELTTNKGQANGYAGLDGTGKVPTSQLPASVVGSLNYAGTWNALTNSPTITSSTGTKGVYYVVSVAGTTAIDGKSQWNVGDWIVFNGTAWDKVDGISSEVVSVAGRTGPVTLSTSDITGLGSAAGKAASGSGGTVASVTGTFAVGHLAVFADTNGTVQDGGVVPTGTGSPNLTLDTTYTDTSAAAIAITDSYSLVNCASSRAFTLAVDTANGHLHTINNYGAGVVTLTIAKMNGVTNQVLTLASGEVLNLVWFTSLNSYTLAS